MENREFFIYLLAGMALFLIIVSLGAIAYYTMTGQFATDEEIEICKLAGGIQSSSQMGLLFDKCGFEECYLFHGIHEVCETNYIKIDDLRVI